MAKKAFDKIMEGLNEVVEIEAGRADPSTFRVHAPDKVNVKGIRKGLGLTQDAFAAQFGLPVATIRDWEQARRDPDTGSRLLLKVIEREPEAVRRALA